MKRRVTLRTIGLLLAAVLLPTVYYGWRYVERQSALDCIQAWGRLAPFPQGARDIEIETTGSAFTRGFRASFHATPDAIERWLSESPGIRDATTEQQAALTTYHIRAGGGATFAEAVVDREHGRVRIRVYWS